MKFLRSIFLTILFFSPIISVAAQNERNNPPPPPPPPGEGQKFPDLSGIFRRKYRPAEDDSEPFSLVFVKSSTDEDFRFLDFGFNKEIEPDSIKDAVISINGANIKVEQINYSKDGRKFRIRILGNYDESYSIKVDGVISWKGSKMVPAEVNDIPANSVFIYDKEKGIWRKFSL